MKRIKNLTSLLLLAIVITLSMTSFVSASSKSILIETPVETTTGGPQTRANHRVLDEALSNGGSYWDQPSNYNSYRINVVNDRSEKLTVTVSYTGNSYSFVVKGNSEKTYTVNNAVSGKHYVDFSTPSGSLSGNIAVRVSDVDQ